jgi:hypothetical protein
LTARFVWLRWMGGAPTAEKWTDNVTTGAQFINDKHRQEGRMIVAEHKITADEAALTIDELSARYPAPSVGE